MGVGGCIHEGKKKAFRRPLRCHGLCCRVCSSLSGCERHEPAKGGKQDVRLIGKGRTAATENGELICHPVARHPGNARLC